MTDTPAHKCNFPLLHAEWFVIEEFTCSCGVIYKHVCDKAKGCYWKMVGNVEAGDE